MVVITNYEINRFLLAAQVLGGNIERVPGNIERVPENADRVPGNLERVPGNAERVPGNAERVPGNIERVPRNSDGVPGTMMAGGAAGRRRVGAGRVAIMADADASNGARFVKLFFIRNLSGRRGRRVAGKLPARGLVREAEDALGFLH